MILKKIFTHIFLLAAIILSCAALSFAQPQTAYDRGIQELQHNNITNALDIWYNAYDQTEEVDSRIGFEFIRVVTEHQLRSYYESATELYYRALTDGENTTSRVALRQEIERLSPIIGQGLTRQWLDWWDNDNANLGPDMRGYWVQQDPTPAKQTNERLIEHWTRITEAKNRFTKNDFTVYDTDERAIIFVRYGEPDRSKSGILTLQSTSIRPWLENQLRQPATRDEMENAPVDIELRDQQLTNRLLDEMYRFHQYPEYEIWFYENLYDSQESPIIFLFGTDVRNNRFALQSSLEDFIPERAFNPDTEKDESEPEFTRAGITPALMLQLLYYEQLAQIDPFFESRLNELRDYVLEQGIQAFDGMDLSFRTESRNIINQRITQAPVQKSTFQDALPKIPLQVHHYRFLDNSSEPYILTYIESSPQEAFLIDYHRNRNRPNNSSDMEYGTNVLNQFPFYELSHNLQSYDDIWNISQSNSAKPELILQTDLNGDISRSFFKNLHTTQLYQSASVELTNINPDSRSVNTTPFNRSLRGWNKIQFRQPIPLLSHPDSLEMADLVLGYKQGDNYTAPFSFTLANDQTVPFGKTLLLHFEVYHLQRLQSGFTQFELTYRILPVDEEGNMRTDESEFVLTLNFTNEGTSVIEDLEIETANLGPGLYELVVDITDMKSDQTKERQIRFEVLD